MSAAVLAPQYGSGGAALLWPAYPDSSGPSPVVVSITGAGGIASAEAWGIPTAEAVYGVSLEPVSIDEALIAARVDDDAAPELRALVQSHITAAREQAEHITHRIYKRREIEFEFDAWPDPGERIYVHRADQCRIRYYAPAGWADLPDTAFAFAPSGSGMLIVPALDTAWPELGRVAIGPRVRIFLTAGPVSPALVPACVKTYIKAWVSQWLKTPEALVSGALKESDLYARLLDPERLWS